MTKLRTISELQDALDREHAWRLKELAEYSVAAHSAVSPRQLTLVRAGVPLLYAHWEGFVKRASLSYLDFVGNQRLTYNQLSDCFVVFGAKRHLQGLTLSKRGTVNIEAVRFFRESMGERANLGATNAVDTKSNLSSRVFENIAVSLGIDLGPYRTKFNLIDVSLLERRNKIAHGEYLDLGYPEFHTLVDETIALTRHYKNDLSNAASRGLYKMPRAAVAVGAP